MQVQQRIQLFDHLVGAGEQRPRNGQAERFDGLEIEYKSQFGGSPYREIARFCAFQNLPGVDADLVIQVENAGSVAHQSPSRGELAPIVNCRNRMASCQRDDLFVMVEEEYVAGGPVAELVGIEGGVVSGVFNLESSGVEAPDRRPRHEEHYHEA